jgi:hypothetical protein
LSSFWFIIKQQWTIEEISIFSNSSHLEWRAELSDTILKWDYPRTIPAKFGLIWFSGFREEDLNAVWETTASQLTKGEWKFRVASKIHFILAGLMSNSCKASRNLKTLATITGLQLQNIIAPKQLNFLLTVPFIHLSNILLILHKLCDCLGPVNFQSADQDIKVPTEVHLCWLSHGDYFICS